MLLLVSVSSAVLLLLLVLGGVHTFPQVPAVDADGGWSEIAPGPVAAACVRCLCEAESPDGSCRLDRGCGVGEGCGAFDITREYWVDANRPVTGGDDPFGPGAYENCAREFKCATQTVQNYLAKYIEKADCSDGGLISCGELAAVHVFGAEGCALRPSTAFGDPYDRCAAAYNRSR